MRVLIFTLLSLINSFVLAENKIETIQINHRLASDVLSEVQPFLPEKTTARASNNYIILQAEPKVITEIKQLINKLDIPIQNLSVRILKTHTALSDAERTRLDTSTLINDNGVSSQLSIKHWSTNKSRNKDLTYQARGIAGKPIMISTERWFPQKEQFLILNSNGDRAVQTKTNYININNGFQTVATILPNHQVSVEIYPEFANLSKHNGVINRNQLFSSISGPVGVWLEIGRVSNDKNQSQLGATRYQTYHQQEQFIYIKVDEIISQ